jgi:hypothetical protein
MAEEDVEPVIEVSNEASSIVASWLGLSDSESDDEEEDADITELVRAPRCLCLFNTWRSRIILRVHVVQAGPGCKVHSSQAHCRCESEKTLKLPHSPRSLRLLAERRF